MKKIFVIDVMAMAFRSYHALIRRPLMNSKGFPTSAIFGSAMFLMKLIESEKPDFLVLATDTKGPTFRHKMYPEYKQNRKEMPEDLALQIPLLFKMFELWNLPLLKQEGVEADDIIGSIATQWADNDHQCYLVSGDKDFMQLINENVFLYSPKKGGECLKVDIEGVKETLKGCLPTQVVDVMALTGDTADNVPGVKGFGFATAGQLVREYRDLDGIYEHLDLIKSKKQQEKLLEYKDLAYLSRQLVIIKKDISLAIKREEAKFNLSDFLSNSKLLPFFEEMEFNVLAARIRKNREALGVIESNAPEAKLISQGDNASFHNVDSKGGFENLLSSLTKCKSWSFTVHSTIADKVDGYPFALSFGLDNGQVYFVSLTEKISSLSSSQIIECLKPYFQHPGQLKISYNLKSCIQVLQKIGVVIKGPYTDVMIIAFMLEPGKSSYTLDSLISQYLNRNVTSIEAKSHKKNMDGHISLENIMHQSCEQSLALCDLYKVLESQLSSEVRKIYQEIELPLIPILAEMECEGILLDVKALNELSCILDEKSKKLQKLIYKLAGEEFNINSPKQLQYILFEKLNIHSELGIKNIKKTKSGFSTDASVLEVLSEHPLPSEILAYRTVTKLKNTYVDTLPQLLNKKTKRIHSNFHQTGTATGRLSSTHPNLQNIPIRSEAGREIRKCFIAQEGHILISADYSQIELRVLAHLTQDAGLLAAFASNTDIHTATAATVFKKDTKDVTSLDRSKAKAINYGIIYGMGPKRLAKSTGVSFTEAKKFMELYFESFPGIAKFIDSAIATALDKGYSQTLTGRRRPIEGLNGEQGKLALANAKNIAVNSPIQGSAADLIKKAMININQMLITQKFKAKMLVQVHDELVFECPESEKDRLIEMIKQEMNHAMDLKVPIVTDIGFGKNWLEAH